MTRQRLALLAKAAVSVALTGYLLSRVDLGRVAAALATAAAPWLVAALAVTMVAALCNTLKWLILFRTMGAGPGFMTLLQLHYIGMFYALLLPGQVGGEVMKVVRLRAGGIPATQAAVSITMDRLTGLVGLGLVACAGLLLSARADLRAQFLPPAAALVLLGLVLLPLLRRRTVGAAWAGWRAPGPLAAVWDALAGYRARKRDLATALGLAVAFQGLVVASNYCVALSVGAAVGPVDMLWIVGLVSLVNLLPIAFAGLGVREGAYVLLLNQSGVPESLALALAFLVFLLLMVQGVAGGVLDALAQRGRRGSHAPVPVASDG